MSLILRKVPSVPIWQLSETLWKDFCGVLIESGLRFNKAQTMSYYKSEHFCVSAVSPSLDQQP